MTTVIPDTIEDVGTAEQLFPYEKDDGEHHTHIVRPTENPHLDGPGVTAQDIVNMARLTGQEVVALCGYRWVPKRDPEKYPACPKCIDIATGLIS